MRMTLKKNHVVVKGCFSNSRQPFQVEGDAVIVATPINILRQIKFTPNDTATPLPPQRFHKAIEDIFTGAATKIFIQTKTIFWEDEGIKGGFSKTNLPIGQLHYPSNCDGDHPGEKGILLVYTWKSEALLFGSVDPQTAVHEAVEQIATIHPQIKEQVETGAVCAWYNPPNAPFLFISVTGFVLDRPKLVAINIRCCSSCSYMYNTHHKYKNQ